MYVPPCVEIVSARISRIERRKLSGTHCSGRPSATLVRPDQNARGDVFRNRSGKLVARKSPVLLYGLYLPTMCFASFFVLRAPIFHDLRVRIHTIVRGTPRGGRTCGHPLLTHFDLLLELCSPGTLRHTICASTRCSADTRRQPCRKR